MELKNPIFKNMHLKEEEKKAGQGKKFSWSAYDVNLISIFYQIKVAKLGRFNLMANTSNDDYLI